MSAVLLFINLSFSQGSNHSTFFIALAHNGTVGLFKVNAVLSEPGVCSRHTKEESTLFFKSAL